MALVVNIHAAKTHLSRLVDQAARGEEIVIARAGRPVARLAPLVETRPKIRYGILAGKVHYAPDWDAPMDRAELARWYEAPIEPPKKRRRP